MKIHNQTFTMAENEVAYLIYGFNNTITIGAFDSDEEARNWAADYHKAEMLKIWPESDTCYRCEELGKELESLRGAQIFFSKR